MPPKKLPPPTSSKPGMVEFEQVQANVYGHRVVVYGAGGIGKTTLVCTADGETAVVDVDESLPKLNFSFRESGIKMPRRVKVSDWGSFRSALQGGGWDGIKNIVLDTWDPIEQWCINSCLSTVRKDDGTKASDIEDYGFGKGYRRVYDHFLPLIGDLDAHIRKGRNVFIVAHDCTQNIPNPAGQDFIRWEPKMQHTKNVDSSIRLKIKGWADHVLFISYDMVVQKQAGDKDGRKIGKAQGAGTRTLYTAEMPHFMAKSRTTCESFDLEPGESPWPEILK